MPAQSTSALEGTYAPLSEVLVADDETPQSPDLREILNYVGMAEYAFGWLADERPLSVALLCDLQQLLVQNTSTQGPSSGAIRDIQVVIGHRSTASPGDPPVKAARFVPPPGGDDLRAGVQDLVDWMRTDHSGVLDPVAEAALSHYQFEALHPLHDGNGRIGRLLIVLHLFAKGVLSEPTLTVSTWFEARRQEYYDRLLAVSTEGRWDEWVGFFATGIRESALLTRRHMLGLVAVQEQLKERVRASSLRADSAQLLVDYAVANPSFTVRAVQRDLDLSYGRANKLVSQLVDLRLLAPVARNNKYNRRFYAPQVLNVLLQGT
jgi:Fic family protein